MGPMFTELAKAVFAYPAIDNHAHPFLTEAHRNAVPFEGLISEAQGEALSEDSVTTLACYRAAAQLSKLFGLKGDQATWESVKSKRASLDYAELCKLCMEPTGIQCILIDDGLGGVAELAEDYRWHDQFTTSPTKRIVRLEVLAQDLLQDILVSNAASPLSTGALLGTFTDKFTDAITASAADDQVAGFKSVACYRTGLDIGTSCTPEELQQSLLAALENYKEKGTLRFAEKTFNDFLVRIVLAVAGTYKKPVQFHTGLGDNDIRLAKSSPSFMQPIIEAFPDTPFVLLHSSYPYTRDAGYLAAVYSNVYLDFGEIFPFVSGEGQRAVVRQMLELCPTNKLLWSTDGHWWPESYYLGTIQAREALYEVLADSVRREELTEAQAVSVVKLALFENSNRVYGLGLVPNLSIL
ncbi:amidohydrolase 2 [Leucogyrophana mollusca]|uniref:Amidohydrolase 2 n=1 Tax=Leucogyrophana mollusca TaxID=85980 RepID=A0ACB8BHQ2_9AGAM|nr:amidohydrolase 2 [Leucogyrophana mollusca]